MGYRRISDAAAALWSDFRLGPFPPKRGFRHSSALHLRTCFSSKIFESAKYGQPCDPGQEGSEIHKIRESMERASKVSPRINEWCPDGKGIPTVSCPRLVLVVTPHSGLILS